METKYKKILIFMAILFLGIFVRTNVVNAASSSITATTTTPTKGQTVTVTGSVTAGAWNLTLAGASQSQVIIGQTTCAGNETSSKSISFTAGEPGTTYSFSLTGGMTDFNSESEEPVSKSITITVANETNNNGTNNNGNNSNTGVNQDKNTVQKSSNANLSNLGIKPNDFSGFTPSKTNYSVTVPNDVSSVEVYAYKGKDSSGKEITAQTVSGTGKKTLQEGANTFNVVVTAEDGKTKKTYTIVVNRETAKEEKTENKTTENNTVAEETAKEEEPKEEVEIGLSTLKISGVTLNPTFKKDVHQYTVKLIGDKTSLDIDTTALDESQKVEVVGNEDLKEGENIITILVSDQAGEKTETYQITVNKSLVDEEAVAKEKQAEEKEKQKRFLVIGITVAAIIIVVIILIVRHRKNLQYDMEYTQPYWEDDWNAQNNNQKENNLEDNVEYQQQEEIENKPKKKKTRKGKRFK